MADPRVGAQQALSASEWQRQKWGETGDRDDLRAAQWEMDRATVNALLAVADHLERIDDALRNTIGGRP